MKKITKVLALVLALSMLCIVFASCGTTLSGTYTKDGLLADTTYKFSGDKVTLSVGSVSLNGTYEITKNDDGNQVITFEFEDSDLLSTIVSFGNGAEVPFEKTDDGIKIGGIEYKKQ